MKRQPYRQKSVVNRKCLKLTAKYFGLYKVVEKVEAIAYKLELPSGARVHHVFHVSQLKKHLGKAPQQVQLPLMDMDGLIVKEPLAILDRRMNKWKRSLMYRSSHLMEQLFS